MSRSLGACAQDDKLCIRLLGFMSERDWATHYSALPYVAHPYCVLGWECGRSMCRGYEAKEVPKDADK